MRAGVRVRVRVRVHEMLCSCVLMVFLSMMDVTLTFRRQSIRSQILSSRPVYVTGSCTFCFFLVVAIVLFSVCVVDTLIFVFRIQLCFCYFCVDACVQKCARFDLFFFPVM